MVISGGQKKIIILEDGEYEDGKPSLHQSMAHSWAKTVILSSSMISGTNARGLHPRHNVIVLPANKQ